MSGIHYGWSDIYWSVQTSKGNYLDYLDWLYTVGVGYNTIYLSFMLKIEH